MDIKKLHLNKSKFVTREVENELVLVPLTNNIAEMSKIFTLNETGKFIWDNIDENSTEESLLYAMLDAFDIDETTAKIDIKHFLEKLEQISE